MDRIDPKLLAPGQKVRPHALIIDDDPVGRFALRKLLSNLDYEVSVARDGAEGVEQFSSGHPDLVFMDMVMPVMDGVEAARQIKHLCGDRFVPIIFVTGNSAEEDVDRCIEAGGDDFLTKPYDATLLAAKIRAMGRIRSIHERVSQLNDRMQEEQVLAKLIWENAVMGANVQNGLLNVHLSPAATFSGDIFLSAYAPSGDLHLLLGDFTGHGLSATIGALPTAETFRAMTQKGFGPTQILGEINSKLHALLPTGLFLAALFVRIDKSLGRASFINCGMPDAWILRDGKVQLTMPSRTLPLAVLGDTAFDTAEAVVAIERDDRIVLLSDGVGEASNPEGVNVGTSRLQLAVETAAAAGLPAIGAALCEMASFCRGMPPADDVSMVELVLQDSLFPRQPAMAPPATPSATPSATPTATLNAVPAAAEPAGATSVTEAVLTSNAGWRLALELRGEALRETNPVPLLMSLLKEFPGSAAQSSSLFTVMAELYNNALDHGVLKLDSRLKQSDFSHYLDEREARLAAPGDGRVAVQIDCDYDDSMGRMNICVQDSGDGFDIQAVPEAAETAVHGRGLKLVRGLCESLTYEGTGNRARAIYAWKRRAAAAPLGDY